MMHTEGQALLETRPHVVIIGAGFGGLECAKALASSGLQVSLIDRNNHHLFQPLLYQVATAALSPADIAAPLRSIFRGASNIHVQMDEVEAIDPERKTIRRKIEGELAYDYLVIAPGTRHSYFAHPEWEQFAPGIKSLDDALEMRRKILLAYEQAEHHLGTSDAVQYTTFVVVGGGPTGVELAGALAEIGRHTMSLDFPDIKSSDIRVLLVEAGDRILSAFAPILSAKARLALEQLGVEIMERSRVESVAADHVIINGARIETTNVLWAAGNQAPSLLRDLQVPLDAMGRVLVNDDCSIPQHPDVFVIGDAAHFNDEQGRALPGVAQVAMQQGRYVAALCAERVSHDKRPPFHYRDRGNMATIGRAKAIADLNHGLRLWGFMAWAMWALIHVVSLIKFRNRFSVMMEWLWYYISYQPGARLILRNPRSKTQNDE